MALGERADGALSLRLLAQLRSQCSGAVGAIAIYVQPFDPQSECDLSVDSITSSRRSLHSQVSSDDESSGFMGILALTPFVVVHTSSGHSF